MKKGLLLLFAVFAACTHGAAQNALGTSMQPALLNPALTGIAGNVSETITFASPLYKVYNGYSYSNVWYNACQSTEIGSAGSRWGFGESMTGYTDVSSDIFKSSVSASYDFGHGAWHTRAGISLGYDILHERNIIGSPWQFNDIEYFPLSAGGVVYNGSTYFGATLNDLLVSANAGYNSRNNFSFSVMHGGFYRLNKNLVLAENINLGFVRMLYKTEDIAPPTYFYGLEIIRLNADLLYKDYDLGLGLNSMNDDLEIRAGYMFKHVKFSYSYGFGLSGEPGVHLFSIQFSNSPENDTDLTKMAENFRRAF